MYELVGLPDRLLGLALLRGQSEAATCGFAVCKIRRTHKMCVSHRRHGLLLDQVSLHGTAGLSFALYPSSRGKCSAVYSPTAKITQLSRWIRVIVFLHFTFWSVFKACSYQQKIWSIIRYVGFYKQSLSIIMGRLQTAVNWNNCVKFSGDSLTLSRYPEVCPSILHVLFCF